MCTDAVVKFVVKPDERLTCPICKRVFNEPWQTSCGHRFCRNCLEPLFRSACLRCPVDGENIAREGSFLDKCCQRELLDLKCSCRYEDRNCCWKGEFRNLKVHEDVCQYGDVQCQACGETLERRYIEQHRIDECINRAVICTYCGGEVRQGDIKDHLEVCLKIPISCNLHCGKEGIPRDMMGEHVTKECTKAEVLCPFTPHGCDFKGKREIIEEHVKNSLKFHLDMMNQSTVESHRKSMQMAKKVSHLENEKNALEKQVHNQTEELVAARINIQTQQTKIAMIEKSISDQRRDMGKLHRDLEAFGRGANGDVMSSQMEEILNTVSEHEMKVSSLQSELTRLKGTRLTPKDNNEPRPNSASSHHACEQRLDRTEHQIALHEIQLSEHDLQIQMLETTSYDGVYLWKIDQYSRRFQEAVSGLTPSIYSPPFYVGRFGYKVCARLYPNGDGMGKGTHMSMFFVVMRGEYDALLPWPFIQKIHFRVLDQDRIRDAFDSFRPDPNSSSFKRPTSDMNIASGCPTFISHTELREGGYIREDTMFIKVTVDMTNLNGELWRRPAI